jgi:predicted acylesterase/phospholipase RssA/CRP-like cAMP-binding protein
MVGEDFGHEEGTPPYTPMMDPSLLEETLGASRLCAGLSDSEIRRVAETVRLVQYESGKPVCRQGESGRAMYILAKGRVKVVLEVEGEPHRLLDYLDQGDHFGEMAMLTDGHRNATVLTVMDSELFELDQDGFAQLLEQVPGFAANLSRTLGFRLRRETSGSRRRGGPKSFALVNTAPWTCELIRPLAAALTNSGDSLQVVTDREKVWPSEGNYPIERLEADTSGDDRVNVIRERLARLLPQRDRVVLDLSLERTRDELKGVLLQCEQIWWLVEPLTAAPALDRLRLLLESDPELTDRVLIVWVLRDEDAFAPPRAAIEGVTRRDMKIPLVQRDEAPSRRQKLGLSRLVHHVHETRVGIALGGGGARGMAHLGVLRALENAGIYFDLMSGTSAGALTGVGYAGGLTADFSLEHFLEDLRPGAIFRALPRGNLWFMLFKFRTLAWDRMLRRYLSDATLEQLDIPFSAVTADLVGGRQIIVDQGDAVHAILESINLPVVSRPILRRGMALVDGGILNNVPTDILPQRGADVVIGVDIASRLKQRFAGHSRGGSDERPRRRPGVLETMMRVNEVQDYAVTSPHPSSYDLLVSVDTSEFDFANFSRANELAEVGQQATEEAIPQIKQLLVDQNVHL